MEGDVWEAACCLFKALSTDDGSAVPDQDVIMRSVAEKMQNSSGNLRTILNGLDATEKHSTLENISRADLTSIRNILKTSHCKRLVDEVQEKQLPSTENGLLLDIEDSGGRDKLIVETCDQMSERCDLIYNSFCAQPVMQADDPRLSSLCRLPENFLEDHIESFRSYLLEALRQVSPVVFNSPMDDFSKSHEAECVNLRAEYFKAKEKLILTQQKTLESVRLEAEVYVKQHLKKTYTDLLKHKLSWEAFIHTAGVENKWAEVEQVLKQHAQEELDHTLHQLGRLQEKAIADLMMSKIQALTMGEKIITPVCHQLSMWEAIMRAETLRLEKLLSQVSTAERDISLEIQRFLTVTGPVKISASTALLEQEDIRAKELKSALSDMKFDVLKTLSAIRTECFDEIRSAKSVSDLDKLMGVVSTFESGEPYLTHEKLRQHMAATLTRWNYLRDQLGKRKGSVVSSRTVILKSVGDGKSFVDSLHESSS